MSKNISEARAKRSVTATAASPAWRSDEDLALLGGDVDLLDRLAAGPVGDLEQRRGVLAPAIRIAGGGQHRAAGIEDRSAAQVRRHLRQEGERLLGGVAGNDLCGGTVGHLRENTGPCPWPELPG